MDNLSYQYLDNSFNPDKAGQYTLLLHGDSLRFSFAVTNKNKLLLLSNHLSWDLFDDPEADNLLFANYGNRIIGLPYSGFTFVPVSIFHPEKVVDFARFLDVKADEKVFSQPLDAENQVLFKVCGDLLHKTGERFELNNIVFAPKGWILANAGNSPQNNTLYLNISGETVEVLNFKDGRLRFYNSFSFGNEDELAYFVTIVATELELQPEQVTITVSGEAELTDQNCTRLQYFFGNVELNPLKVVTLPKQFASHGSLSLTALSLCGSLAEN